MHAYWWRFLKTIILWLHFGVYLAASWTMIDKRQSLKNSSRRSVAEMRKDVGDVVAAVPLGMLQVTGNFRFHLQQFVIKLGRHIADATFKN
jgi:hypothetical protein